MALVMIIFAGLTLLLFGTVSTAPARTVATVSVTSEFTDKTQLGIHLLRVEMEKQKADQDATRGEVNLHTKKLKSVDDRQNAFDARFNAWATEHSIDPKVLQKMQEDIDAIKKVPATVPLLKDQVSALDTKVTATDKKVVTLESQLASLLSVTPAQAEPAPSDLVEKPASAEVQLTIGCSPGSKFVAKFDRCIRL